MNLFTVTPGPLGVQWLEAVEKEVFMHAVERGGPSGILGPLPPHVTLRETRERDELVQLIRAVLENEDLALELDRLRSEEELA